MINVAILGLGTVGQELVKILLAHQNIYKICKILVKDLSKSRDLDITSLGSDILTKDFNEIINNPDIDVIIELIGSTDPCLNHIVSALNNKKAVITANKEVLALHGDQIFTLALKNKLPILYEASICAGIPIIRSIIDSFSQNTIYKYIGIFNGTCNYILSKMEQEGCDYDTALAEAQTLGYAEADPSLDVFGIDAAYKAFILSGLCFKQDLSKTLFDDNYKKSYQEGINKISIFDIQNADRLGYKIRLVSLGLKVNQQIFVCTIPALVESSNLLAQINDVDNILELNSELAGITSYIGPGAGGMVTAASVFADLVNYSNNRLIDLDYYEGIASQAVSKDKYTNIDKLKFKFYLAIKIIKNINDIKNTKAKLDEQINKLGVNLTVSTVAKDKENQYIILLTDVIINSKIQPLCDSLIKLEDVLDCKYIRVLEATDIHS